MVTPTSPTGVSTEEHLELQQAMDLLQQEVRDLQVNASNNEATIRKLSKTNIIVLVITPCV